MNARIGRMRDGKWHRETIIAKIRRPLVRYFVVPIALAICLLTASFFQRFQTRSTSYTSPQKSGLFPLGGCGLVLSFLGARPPGQPRARTPIRTSQCLCGLVLPLVIERPALPVDEHDHPVFENRDEIAQLFLVVLEGVWPAPELQEGPFAPPLKQLLGWSAAGRLVAGRLVLGSSGRACTSSSRVPSAYPQPIRTIAISVKLLISLACPAE